MIKSANVPYFGRSVNSDIGVYRRLKMYPYVIKGVDHNHVLRLCDNVMELGQILHLGDVL